MVVIYCHLEKKSCNVLEFHSNNSPCFKTSASLLKLRNQIGAGEAY